MSPPGGESAGLETPTNGALGPGELDMVIVARDFRTAQWTEIEIGGGIIAAVGPANGPAELSANDDWVAPAFWDIQVNGRWGHSFSSPELTALQVAAVVRAQGALGTARLCPTLITAPPAQMLHGVRTIAAACDADPEIARMVLGIHLEGPFLSPREGYRGAHPANAICDPDLDLFDELQAASGGRIVLLTLAPERPGAVELIARASRSGVVIALGHTAADGVTIREAVAAGAKLSTHLGNGIAAELPRHPNPIWRQAADDALFASLIADGHHLDAATLRVLARAKGPEKVILISDASPLAGLPAGSYGPWAVDPTGKIVVAGTPYLAGSNQSLATGIRNLMAAVSWPIAKALATVTRNPALLLGRSPPELEPGQPASLVVFGHGSPTGFVLKRTGVDGAWNEAGA
jgi:N-acetylglucosamine-6-phosphate deacetylase